ncbi:tumor susceptibility gene 101 protein-like [Rhopilema esculentum]|uniref:tumor susceptibility gene 101 protein-like n=1 Tax=Rhopilema esculentum TaxID=499914 RepID=UPI0031DDA081|eukprot:gene5425-598_t
MSWDSWLKDKMDKRKYPYKQAAIEDISRALKSFSDLTPKVERFEYGSVRVSDLICCNGTIPVRYKGNVYNIPLKLWILEAHPFKPPVVFVNPTSSMVIKPGRHVDQQGRVYLPYLTDWRSPGSDLYELIQILCLTFGDDPPLYSRGSMPPNRPPPPQINARGQQPPYPGMQQSTPYPTSQHSGMPSMPPHGSQPGGYYPPTSAMPYSNSSQSGAPYPTSTSGLPPYPASDSLPTSSYQTYNSQPPSMHQPPQQPRSSNYFHGAPTTSQSPVVSDGGNQTFQQRSGPSRQDSVIDPNVLKMSVLSSVEDKLSKRVKEVFEQAKRELDDLTNTNNELQERKQKLAKIIDKLNQEENVASNNVELLERKNKELTELVQKVEHDTSNFNIDEVVVTTAPLYNQILQTFAEENAVEDAIYYLGEALRREIIDLEVFLKNVRSLSRKQFFLRAQLKKARKTAGLKELTIT